MASPRSKATKIPYTSSEYQLIVQFVKSNIKFFLSLVSEGTQTQDNIMVSASEINALRVLFAIIKSDGSLVKANTPISSYAPFFVAASGTAAAKVKITAAVDWIQSILNTSEKVDNNIVEIRGISKAVTIQENDLQGKSLRITGCEDSYIYINSSVNYVVISSCFNCVIMVAAVSKICSMEKCERVSLSVAAETIRIGNSIDCKLNIYSITQPILYGDNRAIQLGPHNVAYEELMAHIKKAKITINTGNLLNWTNPALMKTEKDSFALQDAKEYASLELPSNFKQSLPLLAPKEFLEILNMRHAAFMEAQAAIKAAKLTPEQEKQLQAALQGHFREWVVSTSQIKPITDLVRMIDNEEFKS